MACVATIWLEDAETGAFAGLALVSSHAAVATARPGEGGELRHLTDDMAGLHEVFARELASITPSELPKPLDDLDELRFLLSNFDETVRLKGDVVGLRESVIPNDRRAADSHARWLRGTLWPAEQIDPRVHRLWLVIAHALLSSRSAAHHLGGTQPLADMVEITFNDGLRPAGRTVQLDIANGPRLVVESDRWEPSKGDVDDEPEYFRIEVRHREAVLLDRDGTALATAGEIAQAVLGRWAGER